MFPKLAILPRIVPLSRGSVITVVSLAMNLQPAAPLGLSLLSNATLAVELVSLLLTSVFIQHSCVRTGHIQGKLYTLDRFTSNKTLFQLNVPV